MSDAIKKIVSEIDIVSVDQDVKGTETTERILSHFDSKKIRFVDELPLNKRTMTAEEFNKSKRHLHLTKFQGSFFKRCPGASQKRALTCCNYFVLNLGQQCNMNCSYCYLQSYLNLPALQVFTNIEDAIAEMKQIAAEHPKSSFRVGTGEVIDSLSLDPLTLYSRDLINFAKDHPQWIIEFKSKSNLVDQFVELPHSGNVKVSWSINPQHIVEKEEHRTSSLAERFEAAKKCLSKGFKIGFHIDPMIWHSEWKTNYGHLIEQITSQFRPSDLELISLGTLRFQSSQRTMMRQRFPADSYVVQSEMLPSESGKLRYDTRLRGEMCQFIIKKFREIDSNWKVYMCMETPETWISSYGSLPTRDDNLKELFRPAVRT